MAPMHTHTPRTVINGLISFILFNLKIIFGIVFLRSPFLFFRLSPFQKIRQSLGKNKVLYQPLLFFSGCDARGLRVVHKWKISSFPNNAQTPKKLWDPSIRIIYSRKMIIWIFVIDEPIQIDYVPDHLEYNVPLSSANTPYHIQKEQRHNFYIDNREQIHSQLNIYNYAIGACVICNTKAEIYCQTCQKKWCNSCYLALNSDHIDHNLYVFDQYIHSPFLPTFFLFLW
jgi:hypothetical protein